MTHSSSALGRASAARAEPTALTPAAASITATKTIHPELRIACSFPGHSAGFE
jgi:hypothetical protein